MKKIIVNNTNRPGDLLLWEVFGFTPDNYFCDAPLEAESIDDLDIDLVNKKAAFNAKKKSDRLTAEAAAKAAIASAEVQRKADLAVLKAKIVSETATGVEVQRALKLLMQKLGD